VQSLQFVQYVQYVQFVQSLQSLQYVQSTQRKQPKLSPKFGRSESRSSRRACVSALSKNSFVTSMTVPLTSCPSSRLPAYRTRR
jgi:hypothetical protein